MFVKPLHFYRYFLFIGLLIGAVVLCFNEPDRTLALLIYAGFLAVIAYHELIQFKGGQPKAARYYLFAALFLALGVQYFDHTPFVGFYILILVANAVYYYAARFSVPFTVFTVSAHLFLLLYKLGPIPPAEFIRQLSIFLIPRATIIVLILSIRHIITINIKNEQLLDSLEGKNRELEAAVGKLSAYADELQKTADIRAREKLMQELHDKLGHILATTSFGTQAAIVLLDKDMAGAKKRLEMVTQQIQAAMQSLREVITGSKFSQNENEGFTQNLVSLMSETEKRTGISIFHNLSNEIDNATKDFDKLPAPKRSFIYNALMEGLTNGIRHGAATRFEFILTKSDDLIHFLLSNNGKTFENISFGYGLAKILGDVKRFGGQLEIKGQNVCTMEIFLPDKEELG